MSKTLEKIKKRGIIIDINIKTITRTRQIIKYLKRESNKWCEFESKNYLLSPQLSCKAEHISKSKFCRKSALKIIERVLIKY